MRLFSTLRLSLLILSLASFHILRVHSLHVRLSNGQRVQGQETKAADGSGIRSFLGIPFGESTGGMRRFLPPKPLKGLPQEPFQANRSARPCWGALDETFGDWAGSDMWNPKDPMSEECLALNIWAPPPRKEPYPVLVWIFGGGFFSGSPSLSLYDGTELAAREHLIVVNINYRLGPFGFLYLGKGSRTGNAGLLDQRLALQWIQREIGSFGGDPAAVTIWGESAGAASASAHLVSEGSWKLFRSAIMHSGGVTNRWALVDEATALQRSSRLLNAANCQMSEEGASLRCLQQLTAEELQDKFAFHESLATRTMEFPFVPLDNDGRFFTEPVAESLSQGRIKDCPTMIGTVADEGTFWLSYSLNESLFPFRPSRDAQCLMGRDQFRAAINTTFQGYYPPALRRSIADFYSASAPSPEKGTFYRDAIGRLYDHFFFSCDVWRFAEVLGEGRRKSPSYRYLFDRRSPTNPWPPWMGVMHGYEMEYFFGVPLAAETRGLYPESERKFAKEAMRALGNFVRGLHPLGWWPPGPTSSMAMAVLGPPGQRLLRETEPACKFWKELPESCLATTSQSCLLCPTLLFFLSLLLLPLLTLR